MTVRIDQLRKRIKGAIDLLTTVGQELDDLHTLAYDRATAVEDSRVSGGSRDYALDTHGDRHAREALQHLGLRVLDGIGNIEYGANEAVKILRGDDPGRGAGPRMIQATELAEAIAAQARRIERGEYVSVRRLPQPDTTLAWSKTLKAKETAERENTELRHEVDRLKAEVEKLRSVVDKRDLRRVG